MFTDASMDTWSIVIGDIEFNEELPFSIRKSKFNPMMFLSGKFTSSQMNWTISQKELYPVLKAFQRVKFLLEGHLGSIHLFTDHKNLISILKPEWSEKASYFSRLRRWSLIFQHLNIKVHHITSYQNSFADILTRWTRNEMITSVSINRLSRRRKRRFIDNTSEKTKKILEKLSDSRLSFMHPYYKSTWYQQPSKLSLIESQQNWFNSLSDVVILKKHYCSLFDESLVNVNDKNKLLILVPEDYVEKLLFWIHVSLHHESKTAELLKVYEYEWHLPPEVKIEHLVDHLRYNYTLSKSS